MLGKDLIMQTLLGGGSSGGGSSGGGSSGGGLAVMTGTVTAAEEGTVGIGALTIPVFLKDENALPESGVVVVYAERKSHQKSTKNYEATIIRFYEDEGVSMFDVYLYGYATNMSSVYCPFAYPSKPVSNNKGMIFQSAGLNPNPFGNLLEVNAGDVYRWIAVGEAFTA